MTRNLYRGTLVLAAMALTAALSLPAAMAAPKEGGAAKSEAKPAQPAAKVDLNAASQAELEKLPGVGPAGAKKIIAARPYASVGDLSKAGIPKKTVEKITPLVIAGPAAATPAAVKGAEPKKASPTAKATAKAKEAPMPPPGKEMVWVNPDSKIYHKAGSKWYGKTKQGSYMSEAEAVKAGFRESKQGKQ